jgi:protein required for attachment to host cells
MVVPLPSPTWILVADASQAQIFELHSLAGPLTAVPEFTMIAEDTHGFSRDLKSDRPGRTYATSDGRHAAVEPRHDPHQLAKDNFARAIAERINRACGEKRFAQFVVVAPPRMLGVLRQDLNDDVRNATAVEINKDLVKADRADILDHVKAALSPAR